ncbi:MAG: hypothetical protein NTV98_04115 [Candidatus Roizmanbacteria bacterium]|nr:hypothetical protein [Candidatus Roizmanbacteria bacterium]
MEKAAHLSYSTTINGGLNAYTLSLLRLPGKQIESSAVHIPLTYPDFTNGLTQLQLCLDKSQKMKVKSTLSSLLEPEIIGRDDTQSLGLLALIMASDTYANYVKHKLFTPFNDSKTNESLRVGLNLSNGALLLSLEKKQIQDKATAPLTRDDEFKKAYYALKNLTDNDGPVPKIVEKIRLENGTSTVMSPDNLSPQLKLFLLAYSSFFHIFDQT